MTDQEGARPHLRFTSHDDDLQRVQVILSYYSLFFIIFPL
jgi:hypothetical protein